MERVLAEEMHGRQFEAAATCCASPGLEDGGFGAQVIHLLALGVGFGPVGFDEAAVVRDVFALLVDGAAEVFLDEVHGCDAVG